MVRLGIIDPRSNGCELIESGWALGDEVADAVGNARDNDS